MAWLIAERITPPTTPTSIYKDDANGTWAGAFSLGWTPAGKQIQCKVAERTRIEVGLNALPPA